MKKIVITENQEQKLRGILNEENGTVKRKVMEIIRNNCHPMIFSILDVPLNQLPRQFEQSLNPSGDGSLFTRVRDNQNGANKVIDFLRLNLYQQFFIRGGNALTNFIPGIARIACEDCGFYSFTTEGLQGGKILNFSKALKLLALNPDFALEGLTLDNDFNGMDYDEFMETFNGKLREYNDSVNSELDNDQINEESDYSVYELSDRPVPYGGGYGGVLFKPDARTQQILSSLRRYVDWCICGGYGEHEYAQYVSNGGKFYILLKRGFEDVPKVEGEGCPLDEYGLSMIAVLVGPDGMPEQITTRWNHDNEGENNSNLWTASQLQRITHINYRETFHPRPQEEVSQMIMAEDKTPAAQDQVHKKVNAGIMDAVTGCGMMEEGDMNESPDFSAGGSFYSKNAIPFAMLNNGGEIIIGDTGETHYNLIKRVIDVVDLYHMKKTKSTDQIFYETFNEDFVGRFWTGENVISFWKYPQNCSSIASMVRTAINAIIKETGEDINIDNVVVDIWTWNNKEVECSVPYKWFKLNIADIYIENSRSISQKDDMWFVVRNKDYSDTLIDFEGNIKQEEPAYAVALNENSNDRKVNKYIKEKFGLTDFQDIRNKVMEIYEKIPYARVNSGQYLLGVLRLLFEDNLPKEEYSALNRILYKIAHCNYYEKEKAGVLDSNFSGQSFDELKEKLFEPDFEGTPFSTAEKQIKVANGFTVTRIDSYDEMNARCDGEWCISYDDTLWYELVEDGTVYLVENEGLIDKYDKEYEKDPEYWQDLGYMAGEEDDMDEKGFINSDLAWTNKLGSWKFPYDYYGLSRFVVIVYKNLFTCYSRWNMPNEFDGDYLTKQQIEKLLGVNFEDVFKPLGKPGNAAWEYDQFGRKVPYGSVAHEAMAEGAEPEADKYEMGSEGGNNDYFHVMNESKIGDFDFKKYFKPIAEFMRKDGLNIYPYPKVKLDWAEQDGLFIKTGYYEPESKTIVIFCDNRHPKDILRTFCHEMIHHSQNLDGKDLTFSSNDDVKDNERLEEIESEAYLKGNIYFRKWTEYAKKDSKDVLQEGRKKVVKNDEGEVVPEKCDKCGGDVVCQIHGEPVYVCKECGKYFGTVPFNLDESIDIHKALSALRKRRDPAGIEDWDSINEDTDPEDIDLSSFNIKSNLNPKFWKDGRLDSRIRMRLLDIADDFIEFIGVTWVKPEDIIMTGSLANYNWNKKFSDIDLHIVMDYSKVDKRRDFVKKYFDSQKSLWNESHDGLKIYGFNVELYVQDSAEPHASTGVYSIEKDKWLTEPDRDKLATAKVNKSLIKKKVAFYVDKIDKLCDIYKNAGDNEYKVRKASENAEKLWDKIKGERKEGLSGAKSEITNGNIIYKCMRRLGYLDKLFSLRDTTYDKLNSINESGNNLEG